MAIAVPILNGSTSNDRRRTVLGVGGAGFNIVSQLNRQGAIPATLAHTNIKEVIRSASGVMPIPLKVPELQPGLPISGTIRSYADKLARRTFFGLPKTDRLILVAGLGGAVGSYITPAIARIAKQAGIQVLGLVYLPFAWEGDEHYRERAYQSRDAIKSVVDMLHVIDMQKAYQEAPQTISINQFFYTQDNSGTSILKEYLSMA
jgi:cell division GTPase FtsZ